MPLKHRLNLGSFIRRFRETRGPAVHPRYEGSEPYPAGILRKVQKLSVKLAIDADMLLAVLTFERDPAPPGLATGPTPGQRLLIHFSEAAAKALEQAPDVLARMSTRAQLECVEKLLRAQAASGRNLSDLAELYVAIHHPRVRTGVR